jgi:anti-sigma B factor antagonist
MDDLARVHVALVGDCYVATITGEIDMSNAEDLARVLEEQLVRDAARHIVDLSGTTYLDSAGVRMLFAISERLLTRGRDLHVVVPEAAPIHRVLLIVDLASRAQVHPRLEDAFDGDK